MALDGILAIWLILTPLAVCAAVGVWCVGLLAYLVGRLIWRLVRAGRE